jgi:hypothetical protein
MLQQDLGFLLGFVPSHQKAGFCQKREQICREFTFEGFGSGTVVSTISERDAVTKEMFRLTEVLFVNK